MSDKTKKILSTVSLGLVFVGSAGAIALGVSSSEVSNGVVLADGLVILVSSVISFLLRKK